MRGWVVSGLCRGRFARAGAEAAEKAKPANEAVERHLTRFDENKLTINGALNGLHGMSAARFA